MATNPYTMYPNQSYAHRLDPKNLKSRAQKMLMPQQIAAIDVQAITIKTKEEETAIIKAATKTGTKQHLADEEGKMLPHPLMAAPPLKSLAVALSRFE